MITSVIFVLMILSTASLSSASTTEAPIYFDRINIEPAWEKTRGSSEVVIAVIDSGINLTAGLDSDTLWQNTAEIEGEDGVDDDNNGFVDDYHGWDFVDQDNSTQDIYGNELHYHGTAVASIIASDHSQEPYGIAPDVRIMDLRVLDVLGSGSFLNIFDAVEYAYENGADIISMSIGSSINYPGDATEVRDANEAGVPVIVSAGNDNSKISEIAKDGGTIAVSSINYETGNISEFSSRGEEIDFAAPGENIPGSFPNGDVLDLSGTSMAAPIVAGTMGLMLSIRSDLPTSYLYEVLRYTAQDAGEEGKDVLFGHGIIDVGNAVNTWENFENEDFDNDGILSGEELDNGSDPFEAPSDDSLVSLNFNFMSLFLLPVLLKVRNRKSN